jgi:hypothetical protein
MEGDGKAVFMEFGTEDEFEEYRHNEDLGWGGFIKKVFNLNKKDETNNE